MKSIDKEELQAPIYASESNNCYEMTDSFAKILLGGNREWEIPDPFPNSEVKPLIADGTAHKSVGE